MLRHFLFLVDNKRLPIDLKMDYRKVIGKMVDGPFNLDDIVLSAQIFQEWLENDNDAFLFDVPVDSHCLILGYQIYRTKLLPPDCYLLIACTLDESTNLVYSQDLNFFAAEVQMKLPTEHTGFHAKLEQELTDLFFEPYSEEIHKWLGIEMPSEYFPVYTKRKKIII